VESACVVPALAITRVAAALRRWARRASSVAVTDGPRTTVLALRDLPARGGATRQA